MNLLESLLFVVVFVIAFCPASLGWWLRKVLNGLGPIIINRHIHIDAGTINTFRTILRDKGEQR